MIYIFFNSYNFICKFLLQLQFTFLCLVGTVASSGLGSCVGILSKFSIGNNLLLKLLRTFSLALKK